MRFHFGFSKFISPKKFIFWLGLGFLALLSYFGFTEQAFAWEQVNLERLYNNSSSYTNTYLDSNFDTQTSTNNSGPFTCSNCNVNDSTNRSGLLEINRNGSSTNGQLPYSLTMAYADSYNKSKYLMQEQTWTFVNGTNLLDECANNTTDLKSCNVAFYITLYGGPFDYATFNQSTWKDTLNVFFRTYDDTNNLVFSTPCQVHNDVFSNSGYNSLYGAISCDNVFTGNSTYTIDRFAISFLNGIEFNNQYSSSAVNKAISYGIRIGGFTNWSYVIDTSLYGSGFFSIDYSDDEPVINEGLPGEGEDDENGLNDIYVALQDDFNDNITGIDTTLMKLSLPSSISDLLTMPLDLTRAIVNNSLNTCSTYDIDLSSIIHKWGDPNDNYILHLPCMRTKISGLLTVGSLNLYNIIDMLLCFVIFYNMIMFGINLIDALTSGEDLFSYFYQPTHETPKGRGKWHYYNSETGEVR